jgi:hypothetical protein
MAFGGAQMRLGEIVEITYEEPEELELTQEPEEAPAEAPDTDVEVCTPSD